MLKFSNGSDIKLKFSLNKSTKSVCSALTRSHFIVAVRSLSWTEKRSKRLVGFSTDLCLHFLYPCCSLRGQHLTKKVALFQIIPLEPKYFPVALAQLQSFRSEIEHFLLSLNFFSTVYRDWQGCRV